MGDNITDGRNEALESVNDIRQAFSHSLPHLGDSGDIWRDGFHDIHNRFCYDLCHLFEVLSNNFNDGLAGVHNLNNAIRDIRECRHNRADDFIHTIGERGYDLRHIGSYAGQHGFNDISAGFEDIREFADDTGNEIADR